MNVKELNYAVQCKRAKEAYWTTIAAFNVSRIADEYCEKCKRDGGVTNEYRVQPIDWSKLS